MLSAHIISKVSFELNPLKVLDLGHTTTNFRADKMIQFPRMVGMENTHATCGLLEDLLVCSSGIGVVSLGLPAISPFANAVGSILGDSVASQSAYDLLTLIGLTATSGSDACTDLRHTSVTEPSSTHEVAAIDIEGLEDVRLAMLADQERIRRLGGKKETLIFVQSHVRGGLMLF